MKKTIFSVFAIMFLLGMIGASATENEMIGVVNSNYNPTKYLTPTEEAQEWADLNEARENLNIKPLEPVKTEWSGDKKDLYGQLTAKRQNKAKVAACMDARFGGFDTTTTSCSELIAANKVSDEMTNAYLLQMKSDQHKRHQAAEALAVANAQSALEAAPITDLSATLGDTDLDGNSDDVTLAWTSVEGNSYKIYESSPEWGDYQYTTWGDGSAITGNTDFTDILPASYTWSITSIFGGYESSHSNDATLTVPTLP